MQQDDITLARLLVRYWWPFWLFRDATRGDQYARASAYRYNREQRIYLPAYLLKWLFLCAFTLALINGFEALAQVVGSLEQVFIGLAACAGISFTLGFCVLLKTAYVYLYLSKHER